MITNPLDRRTTDTGYQGSHRAYDSIVLPDVSIPARDGVQLAADIYLPALNGRQVEGQFPALIERTPYLKDAFMLYTSQSPRDKRQSSKTT